MAAPALVIGRRSGVVPIGLHVPSAIGPVYQSVQSPFGERYSSDELNHRVVVERGDERCAFGRAGAGAGNFSFPRGLGFVAGRTRGTSRLYVCDAWNDRIQVFDGHGIFVFAFGGRGDGPGLFNAPSGLAIVNPMLPGDEEHPGFEREPMVAVSDRENHRLQVFGLDGTLVATVGGGDGSRAPSVPFDERRCWPRGRAGDYTFRYPSRIVWDGGALRVWCADGVHLEVDLAAAMLPNAPEPSRTRQAPSAGRAGLRLVASGGVRCA